MNVLTDAQFLGLVHFMRINYGLDLNSKRAYVETRLQRLMHRYGYAAFADFFSFVLSDYTGNAVSDLVGSLTVNYSLFYREPIHFDFLRRQVLPELERRNEDAKDLRIWSAGCATGEEPYTIAMILNDHFGWKKHLWDTTVLATDISAPALRKAVEACYAPPSTQSLSATWLRRYFEPCPDDIQCLRVVKAIRDAVCFREHNLALYPYPFKKKFHFIFCRNVMIYFGAEGRARLFQHFYDVLEEGGYLFIGLSESMEKDPAAPFQYVMPSVYRKGH